MRDGATPNVCSHHPNISHQRLGVVGAVLLGGWFQRPVSASPVAVLTYSTVRPSRRAVISPPSHRHRKRAEGRG
jgi:hypothetical protein